MNPPTKFAGLHAHSVLSIGDAIGLPQEHIDYALENGMDALALTDHGSMCGISHQQIKAAALKKQGRTFKAIPGIEAYFIDSLADWKVLKEANTKATEESKKPKTESIGNEMADTEAMLEEIAAAKPDDDEQGGTVVEDEAESKKKVWNPVNQRNHLVLLPKNSAGVKALFNMVSESFISGFYKYPRMDFDIIRKYALGNVIASSACVIGSALLHTNFGLQPLKDVVEMLHAGREVYVLSWHETERRAKFAKVVWGDCTRQNTQLLELELCDGRTLQVTPDHQVLTNKGWLRADELSINMPLDILTSDT